VEWPWHKKPSVTFSDMLTAARMAILSELVFKRPDIAPCDHLFWPAHVFSKIVHDPAQKRAA
jgi:hypothetical protein